MKIVAQMDDIASCNIETDSTFAILFAAQNKGHEIFYYLPNELSYDYGEGKLSAPVKKISLAKEVNNHYKIIEQQQSDLTNFDVILLRQDPPFDMNYITTTYFLEKISDKVLILNNPTEVRNCPEKIMVGNYSDLMPPTIFSKDKQQLLEFYKTHGDIILKPLYGCGGEGIVMIKQDDPNFSSILEMMTSCYQGLILAQKFLPEISDGDKRIILLDGDFAGAVLRVAQGNEIRSNFHAGGGANIANISQRDREICQRIGPELKKRGLFFVGIDIIGNYITEINVTSPTGINEIKKLENKDLAIEIVERIEQKISS